MINAGGTVQNRTPTYQTPAYELQLARTPQMHYQSSQMETHKLKEGLTVAIDIIQTEVFLPN